MVVHLVNLIMNFVKVSNWYDMFFSFALNILIFRTDSVNLLCGMPEIILIQPGNQKSFIV